MVIEEIVQHSFFTESGKSSVRLRGAISSGQDSLWAGIPYESCEEQSGLRIAALIELERKKHGIQHGK